MSTPRACVTRLFGPLPPPLTLPSPCWLRCSSVEVSFSDSSRSGRAAAPARASQLARRSLGPTGCHCQPGARESTSVGPGNRSWAPPCPRIRIGSKHPLPASSLSPSFRTESGGIWILTESELKAADQWLKSSSAVEVMYKFHSYFCVYTLTAFCQCRILTCTTKSIFIYYLMLPITLFHV